MRWILIPCGIILTVFGGVATAVTVFVRELAGDDDE